MGAIFQRLVRLIFAGVISLYGCDFSATGSINKGFLTCIFLH